jgi:hypothetical protein
MGFGTVALRFYHSWPITTTPDRLSARTDSAVGECLWSGTTTGRNVR